MSYQIENDRTVIICMPALARSTTYPDHKHLAPKAGHSLLGIDLYVTGVGDAVLDSVIPGAR